MMGILTNHWAYRLRHALLLNIAILILSIASLGHGVSYAHDAITTPMRQQDLIYMLPRPNNK